ncbi:hypothetical protein J1C56_22955 [Aminobacter anthyllidis]|uniref:Uncharacterized protein n=1 Tax=Aminobacter anthyllidis TaxID=1035067 RepID=A0A9X1D6Q6_9HYPH|nr:hypothetical protein [Aminobacter anthyllidis]MBT1158462.1 hypothetical protein [Aminobacter anthyllidis]
MFEITGDDVALLNDGDLRSLVALLCEAELRRRGLPASAVTWGGNQTAADGGLDVRVSLPAGTPIDGFVPRAATGFQVKKPDMPRGEILAEMRLAGTVRPVIQELAAQAGAYIIVSATGSTADGALANRRKAMADAVKDIAQRDQLALDFYDRGRIATWVRGYPGLKPWVRDRIGKSLLGWQPYGSWAHKPVGSDDSYLADDALRIQTGSTENGDGVTALAGLERIRDLLGQPGKVVRLVGLSGVGKTRFVQAIFDPVVGARSLDPSLAVYADMADTPDPQPIALASNLVAQRMRAILVIDNCPQELHRRLSELVRTAGSTISVVTIEYDIREDEPEGTDVFGLEPSSPDLVQKLVNRRFPSLSDVEAQTIAEFSGGNARVALALAETVGKNESLAGLTDDGLFRRLFQQRHEHDSGLLLVAQACALVFSFDGETVTGDESEIVRLGGLVGKAAAEIFAGIAELRRRDLVQQRGIWRAVLPHAIANRLAAVALQNIPWATIETQLVNGASERLLRSFSRRLGYLHGSKEAVVIVDRWLGPDGYVADIANLNGFGRAILENIAPVAPAAVLDAIERATRGPDSETMRENGRHLLRLMRSLAYDPELFDRTVPLLASFARPEADGARDEATDAVESLFYLYLSGTHASVDQRLRAVETWLRSSNPADRALGIRALGAMFEAYHFTSSYNFDFGARPRDHGYYPRTDAEVLHWFESALNLAGTLATADHPVAPAIRALLADKLRGLWSSAGALDALERTARGIAASGFWREGWIAVRQTQKFVGQSMPEGIAARLDALEKLLRPANLIENVRAIVMNRRGIGALDFDDIYGPDDDIEAETARTERIILQLGEELAHDADAFATLLPELVGAEGQLWLLGRGMAQAAPDRGALWDVLVSELAKTQESNRNVQVLRGILHRVAEHDAAGADGLLDAALLHDTLALWFPTLQSAVPINSRGMGRLRQSLASNTAPIARFHVLGWGRATDGIDPCELADLIVAIADKAGGFDVAIEILSMRFHADRTQKNEPSPHSLEAGRELLRRITFGDKNDREDHRLGRIAQLCLVGDAGASIAHDLVGKFLEATKDHKTQAYYHDDLVKGVVKAQPVVALDGLFDGDAALRKSGVRAIEDMTHMHGNPLDSVPDDVLIAWCEAEAAIRYPVAAATVTLFRRPDEKAPLQWTQAARMVLEKAPDRVQVLAEFLRRFRPRTWSGSRAAIIESNVRMLDELDFGGDAAAISFVEQAKKGLADAVAEEQRWETQRDRGRDERFE